jgi:hypothetical protein
MKIDHLSTRILGAVAVGVILISVAGCGDDSGSPDVNVTAVFSTSPAAGTVITDFSFDASASTTSGGTLEYRWDWENDGTWDTGWSTTPMASHRYTDATGGMVNTIEVSLLARVGSKSATAASEIFVDARHGTVVTLLPLNGRILNPSTLTADNDYLWVADWGSPGTGRIYKIDPATGDTLGSIPAPDNRPAGLARRGDYLWVFGSDLYEVNPSSGAVLTQFDAAYSAQSGGLAWDGEAFYVGSDMNYEETEGDGLIHKYSAGGAELATFACPRASKHPAGLAFDGLDLLATIEGRDSVYFLDPVDGSVERALDMPASGCDVAVHKSHIWTIISVGNLALARIVP